MKALKKLLGAGWQYLQEVSGEHDYARYWERALARGEPPISPREFYAQRQQEKYTRPQRCC